MKKVLFVVDEKQMGGVSILLADILRFINIKKYEIDIMVLHNNGDYLDNLDKRINLIYGTSFFEAVDYTLKEVLKSGNLRLIYKKLNLIFLLKTKLIKKKIVKERSKCLKKQYDVEIAFKDGFPAVFTAYGNSKRKYHWLHTDYSMYDSTANYKPLFDDVFPRFDKIIGISENVLKEFKKKYEVKNTQVIYNLIDENNIINKAKLEKITYDKDKINFVSVGRMHPMKGYDRLIEVLNKLNQDKKLENVTVRLIGGGPDEGLIVDLIKKYNLSDKVLFLGRKRNPYPYIKASDCFLMTSRYEPFGLVILEALVLKVPVLATKVLSIAEIMTDKEGLVVENSFQGLYDGLLKIIENKTLLKTYNDNLSAFSYNINEIIKEIEALLDERVIKCR